ncbi:hypothetical protein Tco_1294064, partial [Tanacetum coccineum]
FTRRHPEKTRKGIDRFQQLLSQLEAHGAKVSTEDTNHKFLRSLPPAWSNLAMTMRTNPEIDTLSYYDLCTITLSFLSKKERRIQDLEQIDDEDIEEKDIKLANSNGLSIRMKNSIRKQKGEYTAKVSHDGKKKRDTSYQHQEAGKQEKNQMGLLTMDDNWGEHTEVEETNHALMAISSSN